GIPFRCSVAHSSLGEGMNLSRRTMGRRDNLKLVLFFVALTVVVTWIAIFAWEDMFRRPYYGWVERHFPKGEQWNIQQRGEHFLISTTVDVIVVTLLLRIVERQKRSIRQTEELYRAVFENANDGIGVVRAADGNIVEINKRFAAMLGYSPEELKGMNIGQLVPAGLLELDDAEVRGHLHDVEVVVKNRQDIGCAVSISSSMVLMEQEKLLIVLLRDLSERKKLEAEKEDILRELFQKSKLASIGELSAGVAHEINNPLNAIINFAQLMIDSPVSSDRGEREMLRGIIDEGGRISRIVRNLLTFAGRDSLDRDRVNVKEIIQNSMSLFERQLNSDGIDVQIFVDEDLPPVYCEGLKLRQVVLNIISNAWNALREKESEGRKLFITASKAGSGGQTRVEIEFYDNGAGIAAENLDKVFDPFFTTRRESGGTGLGLSLSFGIVREFGGNIRLESKEGEFTRFTVDIPAASSGDLAYGKSALG
ncbi:MAG TPA: ATP-binding protein, partial [Blastocatellia bacterium]|nr:ATP-binding protein [Blastocatellia bacterium]